MMLVRIPWMYRGQEQMLLRQLLRNLPLPLYIYPFSIEARVDSIRDIRQITFLGNCRSDFHENWSQGRSQHLKHF